ncbi:hypothetical protein P8C59_003571 [Phyllachora maydis]|uniref:Uncharacterized protein n=1 Tax=Phyllachora maydis TaxID=1825666 RepID=A0AAD9MAG6_9PEZI|nr:hypothetical protein P8C59_003571 [Phyllachora maydis]
MSQDPPIPPSARPTTTAAPARLGPGKKKNRHKALRRRPGPAAPTTQLATAAEDAGQGTPGPDASVDAQQQRRQRLARWLRRQTGRDPPLRGPSAPQAPETPSAVPTPPASLAAEPDDEPDRRAAAPPIPAEAAGSPTWSSSSRRESLLYAHILLSLRFPSWHPEDQTPPPAQASASPASPGEDTCDALVSPLSSDKLYPVLSRSVKASSVSDVAPAEEASQKK